MVRKLDRTQMRINRGREPIRAKAGKPAETEKRRDALEKKERLREAARTRLVLNERVITVMGIPILF